MPSADPHRQRQGGAPALSPRDVVRAGLCIGCGGCVGRAQPAQGRMNMDRYGQLKPTGAPDWFSAPSQALARTCPFSPAARNEDDLARARFPAAPGIDDHIGRFEAAYVGHAEEGHFRADGSSGGMVSWVAAELLRQGKVDGVAHVSAAVDPGPHDALFRYRISRSQAELRSGAKSRYYPVELSEVLDEMRSRPGRYAVVGIPCFTKAVHLLCEEDLVLRQRVVFTLGLFCGHMKSARMVESFAWQMGAGIEAVNTIDFRMKDPARPANWYTAQLNLKSGQERHRDWWHLADGDWGAGFFQSSACNFCDDVVAETADISFGDAWLEPYSSDGRGTNVVVVRSPLLNQLLRNAIEAGRVKLEPVDARFIRDTQAAGFRQRREGLALRLKRRRSRLQPVKRVSRQDLSMPPRRKVVYLLRGAISAWSHRIFFLARVLRMPDLYIVWARTALAIYQGFAYSRGRFGRFIDRLESVSPPLSAILNSRKSD